MTAMNFASVRSNSFAIAASCLALAHCSGRNPLSPTYGGTPSAPSVIYPVQACPAIAQVANDVLIPAPGATGVPTAPGQLVLQRTLPVDVEVSLSPQTGPAVNLDLGLLAAEPSPAPTGSPIIQSLPYSQLESDQLYQVVYRDASTQTCPPVYTSDGSFTTQ